MVAFRSLVKPEIIKKRAKKFIRHQSDRYIEVQSNWRKPRGMDNRVGEDLDAQHRLWKQQKDKAHAAFWKFLVHNIKELQCLLQEPQDHRGRAAQLAIRVTHPSARCAAKKTSRRFMCT
ncbi:Putative 60S ribosomal protein L32' [Fukomys damarensis]|uniref:60S ribosomal protein L32 n=1 Tax=Fukomys damarensis TaxID=885580 RepID=A0A091DNF5_FUKDA|nr:Putative 60S ribosomal protein L32' [Fukomys damarensis]